MSPFFLTKVNCSAKLLYKTKKEEFMNSTLKIANHHLMPNYGELQLEIISGKGAWVWTRDKNGKRRKCLDLLCGLGVTSLGHCHPAVVAAINKQAKRLMHVSNLYATEPMALLAERLVDATGDQSSQVFFCNSGTEAIEAAAKLARIWAHEKFGKGKNRIIALRNGFHGRTMFSISLTGQAKMQEKFAPGVPGVKFVALNDIKGLRKTVDDTVCALIFETIQAEGGVNIMSREFYNEIDALSEKYEFLRIVDEVQIGMGRTGHFFSYWDYECRATSGPEIITLAKALGGGLPIGVMIARGEVGKFLLPGSHAATFGGNPVVCAASLAVLKVIEKENLVHEAKQLSFFLIDALYRLAEKYNDKIRDVRGRGLMIGVELQDGYAAGDVVKQMYEKGVLIGTAGPQVVRFLPPFIVTEEELDKALKKFEVVIKNL